MTEPLAPICEWRLDPDPDMGDKWDTDCGESFVFTDGGPRDNHQRFCCYCGKRLKEARKEKAK